MYFLACTMVETETDEREKSKSQIFHIVFLKKGKFILYKYISYKTLSKSRNTREIWKKCTSLENRLILNIRQMPGSLFLHQVDDKIFFFLSIQEMNLRKLFIY